MAATMEAKRAEIGRNMIAFQEVLADILPAHRDEYALIRATEIVQYFPTALDAQIAGNVRFPDRMFSVQPVTDTVEELGSWWHALHPRRA